MHARRIAERERLVREFEVKRLALIDSLSEGDEVIAAKLDQHTYAVLVAMKNGTRQRVLALDTPDTPNVD